ncbi:MAG: DUF1285 domain-containing protein [Hyphomicrobiales bacterium]|nr:DUF1285 domain-containing protein [Hyphomicrobiales bacterium]
MHLLRGLEDGPQRRNPPVDLWTPPHCGDIDMRIRRDGTWFYRGTPITRPQMVRMFSSILRKDKDGYRLVTPVEKVAIEVEDAPFVAAIFNAAAEGFNVVTQLGDDIAIGPLHPLRFESGAHDGIKPYVLVRAGLWALLSRAATIELFASASMVQIEGASWLGLASRGEFFAIAPAAQIEGLA